MQGFDILWCGKYSQDWENEPHQHNFFQLIAVSGGEGVATIGEETHVMRREDILIVAPSQMHGICRKKDCSEPLRIYDVKFDVHDSSLFLKLSAMPNVIRVAEFESLKVYFNLIMKESEQKLPFYTQTISSYYWMVLVTLLRSNSGLDTPDLVFTANADKENADEARQEDISPMRKAEQYILENYIHHITLNDLSRVASSNKTTLTQMFKEAYGTTPLQYIIQVRLQKAKELLVSTNTSVSEISECVGFQSVHYFSRFFKEKEGYSPLEYRMHFRGNQFYSF